MQQVSRTFKDYFLIFWIALRLGVTSFGGPIAHLGYFHEEYVRRKKWLSEKHYADLVALCQFLPGPASSQVGIGIGVIRGGVLGGIVSFIGFTFPSVIALIAFATAIQTFDIGNAGWIQGLKIVAVVVVAHAILGMATNLTPDIKRKTIALFALITTLLWQAVFTQVVVILLGGLIGYFFYRQQITSVKSSIVYQFPLSRRFGGLCLILFFGLLILLPVLRE